MSKADFHKAFENSTRLQVMAILAANPYYDFNAFKELLDITDGNLASHLKQLEKYGFIEVIKSYKGRKPLTQYSATKDGREAFAQHIQALEDLILKVDKR